MHPAIKYAFAALLLLGATLQANADTGSWWQGTNNVLGNITVVANPPTLQICRDQNPDHGTGYYMYTQLVDNTPTNYKCMRNTGTSGWSTYITFNQTSGTCPASLPYDDGTGQCTDVQPIQCAAGSDTIEAFVRFGHPLDFVSANGCQYEWSGFSSNSCGYYQDGTLEGCNMEFTQTDNYADPADEPAENHPAQTGSPEVKTNNDSASTDYQKDPTITNPDGSTTETSTETTTQTSGSGSEVWETDDFVFVRDSTGTTTVYQKDKTVTTNVDGSSTEVSTTSNSTTTPTTTTTTVNKSNGTQTQSSTQGTTTQSTTTTTDVYDSNGNLVSTDSNTTGSSGTQNEGDENQQGNCGAPDQPACEVVLAGEENLTDPSAAFSDAQAKYDQIIEGMQGVANGSVDGELTTFGKITSVVPSTGGTCNASTFTTDYHGVSFQPLSKFCTFYDADVRPIIEWFFWFLTAIGIYYIYVATMRKS